MPQSPIVCAVVGIHGFSRHHIKCLQVLQRAGSVKVAAALAHDRQRDPEWAAGLEASGIQLLDTYEELLKFPELALVTVPVGIHLHADLTEAALRGGKAVFLEKPLAGSLADADRIITAASASAHPLWIGYQDLFQPATWELKRRLLAQRYGKVRKIVVMAGWPRPLTYYQRNNWAGRLQINGTWTLDSPMNNACAHFLNLALFLAGQALGDSCVFTSMNAQLARAHQIESCDTCSLRIMTADGVEIIFTASHVSSVSLSDRIRIECDKGTITNPNIEGEAPWQLPDGESLAVSERMQTPFTTVTRILHGGDGPVCSVHNARAHTAVVVAAHQSATIVNWPAQLITDTAAGGRAVTGLDHALQESFAKGCLLGDCISFTER